MNKKQGYVYNWEKAPNFEWKVSRKSGELCRKPGYAGENHSQENLPINSEMRD